MKLKDLLSKVPENIVLEIWIDHEWLCDCFKDSNALVSYDMCYVDGVIPTISEMCGEYSARLVVTAFSETGGIS